MALVQNPFLLTTLKLFFAANTSTAFPPAYVSGFDVFLILEYKDSSAFQNETYVIASYGI